MKTYITGIAVAATALMPFSSALAVAPNWDVTGSYVVTFVLGGNYNHDMILAQDGSGNVIGSGGYPAGGPYSFAWVITSGTVVGSNITLTIDYTLGAVGTTMHMTGTIAANGTMSGDWDDNYGGGTRNGTWFTSSGAANVTNVPDWGKQLSAARCEGKIGSPVVNVTEKVLNDVDSGLAGNWAIDAYNRHIQVWRTGSKTSNTYCALVTYEGTADAVEGQTGPGGSGVIGSGVSAEMKGGYRATFTGTFAPTDWPTKGSVGTVDYNCDITGASCVYVSWLDKYFPGYSNFAQPWWGWFYYGGTHGNWLNSSEGTFGNIL
jgi:hypothetical protein